MQMRRNQVWEGQQEFGRIPSARQQETAHMASGWYAMFSDLEKNASISPIPHDQYNMPHRRNSTHEAPNSPFQPDQSTMPIRRNCTKGASRSPIQPDQSTWPPRRNITGNYPERNGRQYGRQNTSPFGQGGYRTRGWGRTD